MSRILAEQFRSSTGLPGGTRSAPSIHVQRTTSPLSEPSVDTPVHVPAARVGDFLRVTDSLKVALELAEIAVDVAERRGGASQSTAAIRRQIARLRAQP